MPDLKEFNIHLNLPFGIGGVEGTWMPDRKEKLAAWEMYVELVTRITVVELKPDEGLLRESLNSLYSLFDTTRQILRKYGPEIAIPKGNGDEKLSFGFLAVAVLNQALRPVLAKWHPLLLDYESRKQDGISPFEHERQWEYSNELRKTLDEVRRTMIQYANTLADVAGIPLLPTERKRQ